MYYKKCNFELELRLILELRLMLRLGLANHA